MGIALSEATLALLDGKNYAVLATVNPDGSPQTSVVWVGRDGGDLLFSTVAGRVKHRNMSRDPRVSVTVIDSSDPENYVELRGRVSMTPDVGRRVDTELSWKYDGKDPDPDRPGAVRVIVRMAVEKATGYAALTNLASNRTRHNGSVIDELIDRMAATLEQLQAAGDQRRYFHATYQRTTMAVAAELKRGGFADGEWVERWDVVFADLYLDALAAAMAGDKPARPWAVAFAAPPSLPALRHVLLGMNAHINYDLPQALVAVITDEQFDDPVLLARREADHRAIDDVLASRVAAEDDELTQISGPGSLQDRLLRPFNRLGTQRFLREARQKVWANAITLSRARRQGPESYATVLAQLEELSAAKVAALEAPGPVLLRLAVTGFGVRLPAAPSG